MFRVQKAFLSWKTGTSEHTDAYSSQGQNFLIINLLYSSLFMKGSLMKALMSVYWSSPTLTWNPDSNDCFVQAVGPAEVEEEEEEEAHVEDMKEETLMMEAEDIHQQPVVHAIKRKVFIPPIDELLQVGPPASRFYIKTGFLGMEIPMLTHCSLVMLYGNMDLHQHWLRCWLVAWWYQAISPLPELMFNEVLWHSPESSFIGND